ncbi:MAG: glycosyl transferase, group 1 [Gemmatimonadetes bacterium]|nr:glycosyl transferase, group 1 [Gemmatimonadota bacterium]
MTPGPSSPAAQWVVVQNGAWLGYQIPIALAETGQLNSVATDWYSPLDKPLGRIASRLLPTHVSAALGKRFRRELPSARVSSSPLDTVRVRFGGSQEAMDLRLGARGGRIARAHNADVFSFSYYAYAAFRAAGQARRRIIHQVHPHPASLRTLFVEEMARVPAASESLAREEELRASPRRVHELAEESRMADCCIVASGYTKRTVVENGVDESRVRVIPYGVDLDAFCPLPELSQGKFRVVFVGQMVQRKGLSYLLHAWELLGLTDSELVLAGRGGMDRKQLSLAGKDIRVEIGASRARIRELYQSADVFCMPSLAEGSGLVYLEALACGTPVIGTRNTIVDDIVTEGKDGFVIGIRDRDAIADRLQWCHANRDALRRMRLDARLLAEQFTWKRFRDGVASVAQEIGRLPLRDRG